MNIKNKTLRKDINKELKIIKNLLYKNLPKSILLLNIFKKFSAIGGDVHYACTLPDNFAEKSQIGTNNLGELSNMPNFFICDIVSIFVPYNRLDVSILVSLHKGQFCLPLLNHLIIQLE